jgi:hypothetical protein
MHDSSISSTFDIPARRASQQAAVVPDTAAWRIEQHHHLAAPHRGLHLVRRDTPDLHRSDSTPEFQPQLAALRTRFSNALAVLFGRPEPARSLRES